MLVFGVYGLWKVQIWAENWLGSMWIRFSLNGIDSIRRSKGQTLLLIQKESLSYPIYKEEFDFLYDWKMSLWMIILISHKMSGGKF